MKDTVDVITRSLAAEPGPRHIRVNAALPGPVDTEGNRAMDQADKINAGFLARIGLPRDIATVVAFRVSPEADWITVQIIQAPGRLR